MNASHMYDIANIDKFKKKILILIGSNKEKI